MTRQYFIVAFLLLVMISLPVFANPYNNQFTIEKNSINKTLSKSFPVEKSYQGVTAIFSEPAIDINALDKTIKLNVVITSVEGDGSLNAKGVLVGQIEYNDFDNTLELVKPKLDKFKILTDTLSDNTKVLKAIKQTLGNTLPDIVLYELKNLQYGRQVTDPVEVDVEVNQLILRW
ncbi:hypothetical protein [Aliiglaciecola sp. M165]|uniref:hypothetical protein n=1 Tax=Aliiglaciecola sp. M165 TaxID=2593649 RepID=UPI00117ED092|nr:hypothetical protein [Aliiglaciecola sp. M165]TRY30703.1 hypothetical protein FM019_12495 [Aliiglaciecola sp. M165]